MTDIRVRFNTKHVGMADAWRVFCNGQEHHVAEVYFAVPVYTDSTLENGETKWNVCCEGRLTLKDGKAYIRP